MFHKFFNIGERKDTHLDLIDLSRPHCISQKHDGSLVSAVLFDGEVRFCTKSGFSDVVKVMEERFLSKHPEYRVFCRQQIEQGFTCLFEWCSQRNKIVLEYAEDALILLALRDNHSGRYLPYQELVKVAAAGGIPVTEQLQVEAGRDATGLVDEIKSREKMEGFVIHFEESSELFKIKTDWYFSRANQKKTAEFSLTSERGIWTMILDQSVDDAYVHMDAHLKRCVEQFATTLFAAVESLHLRVKELASEYLKGPKRDSVLVCQKKEDETFPMQLCLKVFDAMVDGEDSWKVVMSWCLKMTATAKGKIQSLILSISVCSFFL
jgi:RNA ligase